MVFRPRRGTPCRGTNTGNREKQTQVCLLVNAAGCKLPSPRSSGGRQGEGLGPGDSLGVKGAQSCPTFRGPMDYTVNGILQARILEWVAFPFSRGSSQPRDRTQVSRIASGFFTSRATREAHELTPNQKKCLFKVFGLLLFYVRTMNNFSIAL